MGERICDTFLRTDAPMALDLFDEAARNSLLQQSADTRLPTAAARRIFDAAQVTRPKKKTVLRPPKPSRSNKNVWKEGFPAYNRAQIVHPPPGRAAQVTRPEKKPSFAQAENVRRPKRKHAPTKMNTSRPTPLRQCLHSRLSREPRRFLGQSGGRAAFPLPLSAASPSSFPSPPPFHPLYRRPR